MINSQYIVVLPRVNPTQQTPTESSLYGSEPRLSNVAYVGNRYYSSMNDVQVKIRTHPVTVNYPKSINFNYVQSITDQDCDISYEVDSPRVQSEISSSGYLNAFLLKKRQQRQQQQQCEKSNRLSHVQQLITQFEQPSLTPMTRRPLSAPLIDQKMKPTKGILQRRINGTVTPISDTSARKRSKSVTFDCHSDDHNTSSTDDEKLKSLIDHRRSPRINVGITLDSRLRKTPALDMLRSTTMESNSMEPKQLNRTTWSRKTFLPIARF